MSQTCSFNDENIYSIDMMIAYIDIFSPKYDRINMDKMYSYLNEKIWHDPDKNKNYSPLDLLNHPEKNTDKFIKHHIKRILNSNLKFPISIYKNNIIDGYHRLTKSYILKKKTIKFFLFDDKIMKKFLLNKKKIIIILII